MFTEPLSVLITGCTPGGIGCSLAKEYHSKGLRVFATARRVEALEELEALGVETLALDVTDSAAIAATKAEIEKRTGGRLDILVNNAGRGYTIAATDAKLDEIQKVFATNVFSVMMMCQAFAPLLIEAKGRIVNIGSVVGIAPLAFGSIYNATKGAIHSYSDTLRVEMAPFGVQVIVIITGGVKSNIAQNNPGFMPDDSIYSPMRDTFLAKRVGVSQQGAVTSEDYANFVVSKTLTPRPRPWLWFGTSSLLVWASTFLPTGSTDGVVARRFGLDAFKKQLGN